MQKGRPTVVPSAELANLLVYSSEELNDSIEICSHETRGLVAEMLCGDIAKFQGEGRKRDLKYGSKLECLYRQVCVGLDLVGATRAHGIAVKHSVCDFN
jgi:hypothetical protein